MGGERKAVLLGNAAAHHANASSLLALANWIGEQTGASVGYLTEAANTVGAQWVGASATDWRQKCWPNVGRWFESCRVAEHRT